jgi:hypothetical protein
MKKYKIIIVLLFFLSIQNAFAQSSIPAAQSVFIYNFTRLIEWPADYKSGDFIIGVIGSAEVFNELKNYTASKMVGVQPIKVVRFNTAADISKCHIIFVSYGKTKELPEMLAKLGGGSTLLVSENRAAIDKGASVNFVILEDKLKFELKVSNATSVGLKIHSNLENMASTKY